jgi:putative FmdB family regulatory protein
MVYEYKCNDCGKVIGRRFSMGQAPATITCPHCLSGARRLFTPLAIHYPARRHDQEMDNLDRDLYYATKESGAQAR